jgi:hypothetical protein
MTTCSTLSNWWMRYRPAVSLPAAPASRRKIRLEDLVRVQRHEADLARSDQEQVVARAASGLLDVIGLVTARGEEARPLHALLAHQQRHGQGAEAVPGGDVVEPQPKHRLVKTHAVAGQDVAAGPRHPHAALEVDQLQIGRQLHVRPGLEPLVAAKRLLRIEPVGLPASKLDVFLRRRAHGHVRVGGLGHLQPQGAPRGLELGDLPVVLLDLGLERKRPLLQLAEIVFQSGAIGFGGLLDLLLEGADLRADGLAQLLLLGPRCLLSGQQRPALAVEVEQPLDVDIDALVPGPDLEAFGISPQFLQVDHRRGW